MSKIVAVSPGAVILEGGIVVTPERAAALAAELSRAAVQARRLEQPGGISTSDAADLIGAGQDLVDAYSKLGRAMAEDDGAEREFARRAAKSFSSFCALVGSLKREA
jgi:hypothetical protein